MMKNKFNLLGSKQWLPFQKSWFRYSSRESLYEENIKFFTLPVEGNNPVKVFYFGENFKLFEEICAKNGVKATEDNTCAVQFGVFDLLDMESDKRTPNEMELLGKEVINKASVLFDNLEERRFFTVFVENRTQGEAFNPFAWSVAKSISRFASLKDEKIGCYSKNMQTEISQKASQGDSFFYSLYFRKDENSPKEIGIYKGDLYIQGKSSPQMSNFPRWYIIKPKSRSKQEVLHPAKYPEELVRMHLEAFTLKYANVFDPMSGTGSTQYAALEMGRNAFGTELSAFFSGIAIERCRSLLENDLFFEDGNLNFRIETADSRNIKELGFPEIDYVITSPPYWDMLNAKGAENQAKRIEKGLQTNYSDDVRDLGNIQSYDEFVSALADIYFNLMEIMKPGAFLTIVVKNIKKKGNNYPFAWDLAAELQKEFELLPETFWLQDDISIAPFGYGNTWVSNTFHQYCLNFRKKT